MARKDEVQVGAGLEYSDDGEFQPEGSYSVGHYHKDGKLHRVYRTLDGVLLSDQEVGELPEWRKEADANYAARSKGGAKTSAAPRKPRATGGESKKALVLEMFPEVGTFHTVDEVLAHAGMDLRNFKTFCGIIKNPKRTKPADIRVFTFDGDVVTWTR